MASQAWFSVGLKSSLVLHALVFASSVHIDFLRWSKIFPNSPHALSHKLTVIRKVKELISQGNELPVEDLMVAMIVLACHEEMHTSPTIEDDKKYWPFNSPLGRGKWLNMYAGVRIVPEHMKALVDLMNLNGGLENVKLHGLADLIVA
jgi:hypothetical protein